MSTAHALPLPLRSFPDFAGNQQAPRSAPARKRSTPQQGQALEILGHAIEYLVDSRLFDQWESPSDAAAVHLLMGCSRAVYADCEEMHPWHQRIQRALLKRLHLDKPQSR